MFAQANLRRFNNLIAMELPLYQRLRRFAKGIEQQVIGDDDPTLTSEVDMAIHFVFSISRVTLNGGTAEGW